VHSAVSTGPSATYRSVTTTGWDSQSAAASASITNPVGVAVRRRATIDRGTVRHHTSRTAK
jgi:hypothetical protein